MKELLSSSLPPSEKIERAILGIYAGKLNGMNVNRTGLLAATQTRVIFYSHRYSGESIESIPYENISAIEHAGWLKGHSILFRVLDEEVHMKWISDGGADEFIQFVNERIELISKSTEGE